MKARKTNRIFWPTIKSFLPFIISPQSRLNALSPPNRPKSVNSRFRVSNGSSDHSRFTTGRGSRRGHTPPRPEGRGCCLGREAGYGGMRASSAARAGVGTRRSGNEARESLGDGVSHDMRRSSESGASALRGQRSSRKVAMSLMREGGIGKMKVCVMTLGRFGGPTETWFPQPPIHTAPNTFLTVTRPVLNSTIVRHAGPDPRTVSGTRFGRCEPGSWVRHIPGGDTDRPQPPSPIPARPHPANPRI
jgi:hypothetical protein